MLPKTATECSTPFRISSRAVSFDLCGPIESRRQPFRFDIPHYRALDRQIIAGKTPHLSNSHRFLEKDIGIQASVQMERILERNSRSHIEGIHRK